jgi:hypothetical protein
MTTTELLILLGVVLAAFAFLASAIPADYRWPWSRSKDRDGIEP